MSLLSKQDYELVEEALNFFLSNNDNLTLERERQFITLRQWVLLQKAKIAFDVSDE